MRSINLGAFCAVRLHHSAKFQETVIQLVAQAVEKGVLDPSFDPMMHLNDQRSLIDKSALKYDIQMDSETT